MQLFVGRAIRSGNRIHLKWQAGEREGAVLCFGAWISSLIWLTAQLNVHCWTGEAAKGWGGMGDIRELLPPGLLLTVDSAQVWELLQF